MKLTPTVFTILGIFASIGGALVCLWVIQFIHNLFYYIIGIRKDKIKEIYEQGWYSGFRKAESRYKSDKNFIPSVPLSCPDKYEGDA